MIIEFTTYDRPKVLASSTRLSSMDIQVSLTFDVIDNGTFVYILSIFLDTLLHLRGFELPLLNVQERQLERQRKGSAY